VGVRESLTDAGPPVKTSGRTGRGFVEDDEGGYRQVSDGDEQMQQARREAGELHDWLVDPNQPGPYADGVLHTYTFRYMTSDGLLATINSQQLRMNAWSKMNDPREAMVWRPMRCHGPNATRNILTGRDFNGTKHGFHQTDGVTHRCRLGSSVS
jgi:hypothetical protein